MERLAKRKHSDNLRTSGENSDPIPLDLFPEILKGLPVKTLARFLCVSKHWESIIRNRYFIKSYLIKSSTRPQGLFFTFESKLHGKRFFFSASHPQNRGDSLSYLATYHMTCCSQPYKTVAPSVHGLICHGLPSKLMVYNPSTRRSITLPKIDSQMLDMYHYLGYNPVDGNYKVLCMTEAKPVGGRRGLAQEIRILTLGNGNSWRMIEDYPPHSPESLDICINGVLYYEAFLDTDPSYIGNDQAVMSFDVRSEILDLIKLPESVRFTKMTSYKGKLALMSLGFGGGYERIDLLVLEDTAKHEWSSECFVLPNIIDWKPAFHVFCATDAGDFFFAQQPWVRPPFYVLYYDPKKGSVTRVDIEGISDLKLPLWNKVFDLRTISVSSRRAESLMFL